MGRLIGHGGYRSLAFSPVHESCRPRLSDSCSVLASTPLSLDMHINHWFCSLSLVLNFQQNVGETWAVVSMYPQFWNRVGVQLIKKCNDMNELDENHLGSCFGFVYIASGTGVYITHYVQGIFKAIGK